MNTRTTQRTVRFRSSFLLYGFDAPQPPGAYIVEEDEEQIDGTSFIARRRTCTFIHLPAIGTPALTKQMLQIDPADLEDALRKDTDDGP